MSIQSWETTFNQLEALKEKVALSFPREILYLVILVIMICLGRAESLEKYHLWIKSVYFSLLVGHFGAMIPVVILRLRLWKNIFEDEYPEFKGESVLCLTRCQIANLIDGDEKKEQFRENYPDRSRVKGVPAWLIGLAEGVFFTTVVAFEIGGAAVAMMGWLTVKMLSGWNRGDSNFPKPYQEHQKGMAFTALFGGLISLLFATIGGLILRQDPFIQSLMK